MSAWNNTYNSLRLFTPGQQGAILTLGGASSIQFVVTDPLGRRTGVEQGTGSVIEEIPGSSYIVDSIDDDSDPPGDPTPEEKIVEIFDPVEGVYTVQITGLEADGYIFHFFGYDMEQNPTGANVIEGRAVPGVTQTYLVSYSPTPGSTFEVQAVIDIDVKPGSTPNSINPSSKGVLPVAVITTETFDATAIDPLSIRFGPGGASESHNKGHIEDVDSDGDMDLVLHFETQDTTIQCGDTSVPLTGETFEGLAITGSDAITTVGCEPSTAKGQSASTAEGEGNGALYLPLLNQ